MILIPSNHPLFSAFAVEAELWLLEMEEQVFGTAD
jgi:hypothetical protein